MTVSRRRLIDIPGQVGDRRAADAAEIDAAEVRLARQIVVGAVTASAVAGVGAPQPHKGFPFCGDSDIERHHDDRCPGGFRPLDELLRPLASAGSYRAETTPARRARRSRPRSRSVATVDSICRWLPILAALATAISHRDERRGCCRSARSRSGCHISRPKISTPVSILLTSTSRRGRSSNFRKPSRLARKREFVIDAGGHVAEMRRGNVLLHDRLEVEDVERLGGIGNQFVEIARRPVHRIRRASVLPPGRSR